MMNCFGQRGVLSMTRRSFFTTPLFPTTTAPQGQLFRQIQQFQPQQQQQSQHQFLLRQQHHQLFTPQPVFNMIPLNGQIKQQNELKFAQEVIEFMNRNKRKPKKANHGARPCSSVSRSKKKLRRHHYPK